MAALLLFSGAPIADVGATAVTTVAPSVMTVSMFRDRMIAAARRARPESKIEATDAATFVVKAPGAPDRTINVANAHALYVAAPADLDTVIARYVAILVRASADDNATLDQLIVIVRPSTYLSDSVRKAADLSKFVLPRPMAGDLSFFLAVDASEMIRTLSVKDLAR